MNARTWGQRLNEALGRLLLQPTPPGVDFEASADRVSTGKGGHGTHKARGQAPTGALQSGLDRPEFIWWLEQAERLVLALERDVEHNARRPEGTHARGDRESAVKRATDRRIVSEVYEGRDPTFVAFLEGRTTEGVRKLRQRHQRDPDDGSRLPASARPITAPARDQAEAFESTTTTTKE